MTAVILQMAVQANTEKIQIAMHDGEKPSNKTNPNWTRSKSTLEEYIKPVANIA